MKINRFFTNVFLLTFISLQSVLIENVNAQNAPPNTRLFQLNTAKGSALTLIESSDNYVYHVGTSNSSEIGIDGIQGNSVGLDDLFILKSDAITGANQWVKTFNAGSKGTITPRYVYIDSSENIFVYGQFSGTITAGATSISSNATAPSFLLKINSIGNAVWATSLSGAYNSTYPKIKITSDGTDVFLVYDKNRLTRINETNGSLVYEKTYPEAELKSVLVYGGSLYIAGATNNASFSIGTEIIDKQKGFILKGDKNANFISSAKIGSLGGTFNQPNADMNDIAISKSTDAGSNGIVISGFTANGSTGLVSESGTFNYTYNPNSTFSSNYVYHYVAKIDVNLQNVAFFKTSSQVYKDNFLRGQVSSSIKFKGQTNDFRILRGLYNIRNYFDPILQVTNANGSVTTPIIVSGVTFNKQVLSFNSVGNYNNEIQKNTNDFVSVANNSFTETVFKDRIITSNNYNIQNNSLLWTKKKTSSIGGGLSNHFQRHLNSAKNEMFVTSMVNGKADFFGKQVNNAPGLTSRYITRLAEDGTAKWHARFQPDNGFIGESTVTGRFATVDNDDNFLILAQTSDTNSTFIDANGSFTDFSQNSGSRSSVIIKLNKDGVTVWSKQLIGAMDGTLKTDSEGNVYFVGNSAGFTVDGVNVNKGYFVLKFSANGNLLYSKAYPSSVNSNWWYPAVDAQNNLYVFLASFVNDGQTNYSLDGVTIPARARDIYGNASIDLLMFKFNNSGNVIWGKNFYENASPDLLSLSSFPTDVVFDGTDFIMNGVYSGIFDQANNPYFLGLDGAQILQVYFGTNEIPYFAKISPTGNVIWQKPVHNTYGFDSAYNNIEVDADKNIYMYFRTFDKVTYNGNEYLFSPITGNTFANNLLMKINSSGDLAYLKQVHQTGIPSTPKIDVIGNDKLNISSLTDNDKFMNYPIDYNRGSSIYIATFGNLDSYYLSPIKDYKLLTNLAISNNPNNENYFTFDLVNNVNWSASSDQSWLTISVEDFSGNYNFQNSLAGTNDVKIILKAQTNASGQTRSANINLSGDQGVNARTVIVTQTFILATGEAKTVFTTLYPNPTSDILNIETDQKISKIEVYDASGKLAISTNGKDKKVTVSNLNNGMYFIKLYTENGVINSKFIKK